MASDAARLNMEEAVAEAKDALVVTPCHKPFAQNTCFAHV
jgi:hypothetical protein